MGTPDFAVPSLDVLVKNQYEIAGVVTAPDKPAGRGQHLHTSAIKKYAGDNGLKILQPVKLKDETFQKDLRALDANLFIVVAFRMLPEAVWQMPEFGTFNLHASLLPQYRGAAPINWAVINGEKETGVTTFFLKHEIDTGNILFSEKIKIEDEDNAGSVHDKLSAIGAELVLKTVKAIEENNYIESPQSNIGPRQLKHAPKIFKEDCRIDWNKSATEIGNLIRGLSPHPTAFTHLDGKMLKVYNAGVSQQNENTEPGSFQTDNKTYLRFKCGDRCIDILELQLEGKKRMKIDEFLRGHKL